jgi:hypothetical protein
MGAAPQCGRAVALYEMTYFSVLLKNQRPDMLQYVERLIAHLANPLNPHFVKQHNQHDDSPMQSSVDIAGLAYS